MATVGMAIIFFVHGMQPKPLSEAARTLICHCSHYAGTGHQVLYYPRRPHIALYSIASTLHISRLLAEAQLLCVLSLSWLGAVPYSCSRMYDGVIRDDRTFAALQSECLAYMPIHLKQGR